MWNLFSTSSEMAGFRLQYMEIYNWGTFDEQIFQITPQGNNSLLTGANGSGKTTFIDALLTLLVPAKRDRFYNQSSGVEKKGDRTEESYVCGHYGDIQKAGEMSTTTQMLRNKTNTRSVLLASFSNNEDKVITIFQVRWFVNREMKRAFGIAHQALHIATDFEEFDGKGIWKRRLSKTYNANAHKRQIEFLDGPIKYGKRLAHLLGMRSPKALGLFNQVVGIKVLGNLDEFIRGNMLEEWDAEAEYVQLKESFLTLMEAKTNIEKAKEQIKQLDPINELALQLEKHQAALEELDELKELSVFWFAKKGVDLAGQEGEKCERELALLNESLEVLQQKEAGLKEEESNLMVQIKSDAVGTQIRQLEVEINRLSKQIEGRKSKLDEYNELAEKVKLDTFPTPSLFQENRERAKESKRKEEERIEQENENLRLLKNKRDDIQGQIHELEETITSLFHNKNNISGRVAAIREDILAHVNARREDLPFVGELIKVKEDEMKWEGAIEKVLHSFALRLIVPERYYHEVNEYVNKTNLKGRIVYQRFKEYTALHSIGFIKNEIAKNALIHKIRFKSNNPYTDWIQDEVINRYNFSCVANLKAFARISEQAITKEGLIKFRKGKHEKDDRAHVSKRSNYVLGWDNKDKIRLLKGELRQLKADEKEVQQQIRQLQKHIQQLGKRKDDLHTFYSHFTKHDEIDWESYAAQMQQKSDQKKLLERANDKVRALQQQLKAVQIALKENVDAVREKDRSIFRKEGEWQQIKVALKAYQETLDLFGEAHPDCQIFETKHKGLLTIAYAELERSHKQYQAGWIKEKERVQRQKNKKELQVSALIGKFKNPEPHIYERFKDWRSDVHKLPDPDNLEFIGAYQKRYTDLIEEDLPRFEAKFNEYLQETIINKVGDFRMFFVNWSEDIKDEIQQLNESLQEIDYNTGAQKTYIQLVARYRIHEEIKLLRDLLRQAIPNFQAMEASADGKKHHFDKKIAPLIRKLEDEKWRSKVMDVRAWFSYKAEEYNRETKEPVKTYENMGQLSGGEKAQMTYTILGSAIACKFGLTKSGRQTNSFRFIAIDEAFKAQDEERAKYLMKLCKQLHLQLLVVTPSDNIHIVEPYISYVHFVERRNNRNSWLYNMPIQQFKKRKMELENQSQIEITND